MCLTIYYVISRAVSWLLQVLIVAVLPYIPTKTVLIGVYFLNVVSKLLTGPFPLTTSVVQNLVYKVSQKWRISCFSSRHQRANILFSI